MRTQRYGASAEKIRTSKATSFFSFLVRNSKSQKNLPFLYVVASWSKIEDDGDVQRNTKSSDDLLDGLFLYCGNWILRGQFSRKAFACSSQGHRCHGPQPWNHFDWPLSNGRKLGRSFFGGQSRKKDLALYQLSCTCFVTMWSWNLLSFAIKLSRSGYSLGKLQVAFDWKGSVFFFLSFFLFFCTKKNKN